MTRRFANNWSKMNRLLTQFFALKVQTAVQFLKNPKVTHSSIDRKQQFLIRKGLTNEEIKAAFDLASVDATINLDILHNQNTSPLYTAVQIPQRDAYPYCHSNISQLTLYQKIKELLSLAALIGATVYCAYWFYKVSYHSIKNYKFFHTP